ncbi:MAG: DUF4397 domain-containing protein [Deltaproteobacteria bacterium]
MKKASFLIVLFFFVLSGSIFAQTAKVQIIHNSADAAAKNVDIYINGKLALNDFAFRTATPFINIPAWSKQTISIAPSSSKSVADAVATFNYTFKLNKKYVAIASGTFSGAYNPYTSLRLNIFDMGRDKATKTNNTDVLVFHGSTDAPVVDVVENAVPAGTIVNDLEYGKFRGYLELPTNDYTLQIRDKTGTTTVASYEAPLKTLGLQNQALTVVASGFLNPSKNINGPSFGLWVALASGGALIELPATQQTAKVQVIHNSADAAAQKVDVYVNGTLALNDFAFRTATPFIDIPAGVAVKISIAPSTSTSVNDAIANFTYTLKAGGKYIIVANGIVSPQGYSPAKAFDLYVYDMAREKSKKAGNTDVFVFHGSSDAPEVDVVESSVPAGTIIDDMAYGQFKGYLELTENDYVLQIKDKTGTVAVASYDAPIKTLGLQNQALTVVASGFLNPSMNSNGKAFGLYVALPSGGDLIALPSSMAKVQVIHNSADAAAQKVDVYVNGTLALNDFAFRTATPFIDIPAGVAVKISIAPSTSTSINDAIANFTYTLKAGGKYIIVANGIVSPQGYSPAKAFDLYVYDMAREKSKKAGNTDVLVFHGSSDAPEVDVVESSVPAGTIIDDMAYGQFKGYLELAENDYLLRIKDKTGTVTVASYRAPIKTLGLQNQALTVVASGFLNPSMNSNGKAFGLYVALASGGELIPLPVANSLVYENSNKLKFNVYPNPATTYIEVELTEAAKSDITAKIFNRYGMQVASKVFSNGDVTKINTYNLNPGSYYITLFYDNKIISQNFQIIK